MHYHPLTRALLVSLQTAQLTAACAPGERARAWSVSLWGAGAGAAAPATHRSLSSRAGSVNPSIPPAKSSLSLSALMARGVDVSVLEFEISEAEAVRRFEEYQRAACKGLHASALLRPTPAPQRPRAPPGAAATAPSAAAGSGDAGEDPGVPGPGGSIRRVYLPYWCFEATFSSECSCRLGFKDEKTGEVVWKPMDDPLTLSTRAAADFDDVTMQVYGAYNHVRDVGGAAAGQGLPGRARALTAAEAEAGAVGGASLEALGMRQGVAWALAVRALTRQQLAAAEVAVRRDTRANDVKELHVAMQMHTRNCRLVFLPAYIAVYQYGTRYKQGTSGVILPQVFTAAMGGTREGGVVAPQHVSPAKASLGGGGVAGGLGLLAGELGSWLPLLPPMGPVEALTMAALAASGAGMWAHQRPQTQRAVQTAKQVRADYEFYKQYDRHEVYGSGAASAAAAAARADEGVGGDPGSLGNEEYMLWLWSDADWRRWEHDEPWNWDPQERRKWAEQLWRRQAARRLERQRFVARMVEEAQRRAAEEEQEARRAARYGSSARFTHRPRDHGIAGESGYGGEDAGRHRRRRSDFLGYYRALGLQDAETVSMEDIKVAFKKAAMQLHPDRQVGADEEVQRTALVRFQKLQIAYDTLKDDEKRRLYDRGQLVQ
ncbi:hypothetical protein HYH03_009311 [Edaphochlamys debaryana]|uniref:J domain-containing protein n=1 Tax=Edaphochlamys debaryana TaxID=47281 RepID=A0A835XY50_9CHLO|nr:hypothetical protein HYH03_009311 [Edaphochlamys debaryana]|eukprot:KAG2492363.1 hypothetical protein HYH03_009311 [Edaphochlamys debaryana]